MAAERFPLEPTAGEMRSMGHAALAVIEEFIHGLPEAPAVDLDGAMEVATGCERARPRTACRSSRCSTWLPSRRRRR
jgi:hypothetical protein